MWSFIKRKLEKRKRKRTFREYGYDIKEFTLPKEGRLRYAQWKHYSEKPKQITQEDIDFYRNFVKEGEVIIDIGAHTGDTSVPMAFAVGKTGKVLALEPNPYVFKVLKQNSELNKEKSGELIPLNFAATAEDGEFIFNYSDASFCNGGFLSEIKRDNHHHNFELKVQGRNLEKYIKKNHPDVSKKLGLIKVDAEGYDKEIIKTLSETIEKSRPVIITECYKRLTKEEREELYDVIASKKYVLYHLKELASMEDIVKIEKSNMIEWPHFDILAIPEEKENRLK